MKKKSFLLYLNYANQINRLSDEQCGKLLKAIYAHETGEEGPVLDALTDMAFSVIADALDRDRAHYEEICEKRSEAGKKGAAAANSAYAQKAANADDNDNENDNEKENDNENEKEKEKEGRVTSARAVGRADGARGKKQDPTEARAERERYYSVKKYAAEQAAQRVREEAERDEEFFSAEQVRKETEIALARAEVSGTGDIGKLKEVLAEANKKRARALERLHLSEKDLLPVYSCKACSDTGFLPNGLPCKCYGSSTG